MPQRTKKTASTNRPNPPLFLLLIAGLFLSLGSNLAASYQWHQIEVLPGNLPDTSGLLTIPDQYDTPGVHIIPPSEVSGSFIFRNSSAVFIPDPDHSFGIKISPFGKGLVLTEIGPDFNPEIPPDFSKLANFWTDGEGLSLHGTDNFLTTKVVIFEGLWQRLPDGGSTLLSLLAGLLALGIAGRHARLSRSAPIYKNPL